jgi:hypothetical protein
MLKNIESVEFIGQKRIHGIYDLKQDFNNLDFTTFCVFFLNFVVLGGVEL